MCYYALGPVMKSKSISRQSKLKIYCTIIRPVVMYALKTWGLNEKEIRMLSTWETNILRKIYGAKKEGNEWKIRNNQELRNMYGQPDIIAEIKSKRLECLGHVDRMEENTMVKRVFEGHPGGKRKTARPRKRWLDDIEEDLRLMKVKRWRRKQPRQTFGQKSSWRPRPCMGCSAKE
jgi:hypothetical protein